MTVSATDFLDSAKALLSGGTDMGFRNAVSRSYYAAYHVALQFADQRCPDQSAHLSMGTHERLHERFKVCTSIQNGRSLAYMLKYMKDSRRKADYELRARLSQSEAETAVKTAEKFFSELADLATSSQKISTG